MPQSFFRSCWQTFGVVLLSLTLTVGAGELEFAGAIGNSGAVNNPVKIVQGGDVAWDDAWTGGVWVDPDGRVYLSGGRVLNHFNMDGALHRSISLDPVHGRIKTSTFAALDGCLYFFGIVHPPGGSMTTVLFRLRLDDENAAIENFADFSAEYGNPGQNTGTLAAEPRNGKLVFAAAGITVSSFDPATKAREVLFRVPGGQRVSSVAIAPDGESVFVGGYFGLFDGSRTNPNPEEIMRLDWNGNTIWRRTVLDNTAEPVAFPGILSPIGDGVWDFGRYGFASLYRASDGAAIPGRVAFWDMRMSRMQQVADIRRGMGLPPNPNGVETLAMSEHWNPANALLATWDGHRSELTLQRRLGSLPGVTTLGISPGGWVVTNGLWWRFDDAAYTPPTFANYWRDEGTSGTFVAEDLYSLLERTRNPIAMSPQPAFGRNTARDVPWLRSPFGYPRGYTVDIRNRIAYASGDGKVWRTRFGVDGPQNIHPQTTEFSELTGVEFRNPGSLAVLSDGSLLVADDNELVVLTVNGTQAVEKDRHSGDWGGRLQVAADGGHVLLADTDNHRVLLLDAETFETLSVVGDGAAGAGASRLDGPTGVAIANGRAVVADTNNQRIVKFLIRE